MTTTPWSALALLLVSIAQPLAADEAEDVQRFEFTSYRQIVTLFDEVGYTDAAWDAGIREIPRLYLTSIPPRWREKHSKEVVVRMKKELFFRAMAPLALRSNELIAAERGLITRCASSPTAPECADALLPLARRYGVIEADTTAVSAAALAELKTRVDEVPVSLMLAQAAEESGWATSRFAAEGNALFGQWTWGDDAITPLEQRAGMGNYGIKAFPDPLQSVQGYMHNLNTHRSYAKLRDARAAARARGEAPKGFELARSLDKYSERGAAYVDSLHAIMRVNKLTDADEAVFAPDSTPTLLIPTETDQEG